MDKILITGGAGFIGSHLCEFFLQKNYQVICVDNLLSGRKQNINHLFDQDNFEFINHDVTKPLPSKIQDLDAIFHFASPASPNPESEVSYMANPVETLMVNSLGTKHMLDFAKENDCQIILASTSEIYGDPEVHPQTEDYLGNVSSIGPRSCYDEAKRFLESISFTYHREFKVKIKVIRIFNTYGPHMRLDDGRFIPSLYQSFFENKPFFKYASDKTTRSFCYIDDLIEAIGRVYQSKQMIGEVVNLGNDQEIRINDAIDLFQNLVENKLEIIDKPELENDPQRRRPDLSKAKNILDWQPEVSLKNGLLQTLKWYREK